VEFETSQLKNKNAELELEVDQLKKKNIELERKLESIISKPITEKTGDHLRRQNAITTGNTRDFLPRSCYEIKAENPNAQSGLYFIDPDGQVNGDDAIQVYCDMTTSKI